MAKRKRLRRESTMVKRKRTRGDSTILLTEIRKDDVVRKDNDSIIMLHNETI
jgi:hypothetical protein